MEVAILWQLSMQIPTSSKPIARGISERVYNKIVDANPRAAYAL